MNNRVSGLMGRVLRLRNFVIGGLFLTLAACPSPNGGGGPTVDLDKPVRVALLVPTGGADDISILGATMERAAKLALADHNKGEIELVVYPTAGNDAQAAAQAAKAQVEGANLIVGPLKSSEAAAVANVTQVPILAFSNNAEVAGGNTYLLGTSFDVIASRVLRHAKSQGETKIGVIATDDLGGTQGVAATRNAASKIGSSVVYAAQYPLSVAGIQSAAPGIAAALRAADAEAVMFTDAPTGGLGLMSTALSKQGYSSQSATYLGLANWGSVASNSSLSPLEGGYFAVPNPAATSTFDARYLAATGSRSSELTGLAYDGVLMAISLVRTAKSKGDRTPFGADNLHRTTVNGALGEFSFDGDNHADRSLAVMQVRGGQPVVVSLPE